MQATSNYLKRMGIQALCITLWSNYHLWFNFNRFAKSSLIWREIPGIYYSKKDKLIIIYYRTPEYLYLLATRSENGDYPVPRMRGLLMSLINRALSERLDISINDKTRSLPIFGDKTFRYNGTLYSCESNNWQDRKPTIHSNVRFYKIEGKPSTLKVKAGYVLDLI